MPPNSLWGIENPNEAIVLDRDALALGRPPPWGNGRPYLGLDFL